MGYNGKSGEDGKGKIYITDKKGNNVNPTFIARNKMIQICISILYTLHNYVCIIKGKFACFILFMFVHVHMCFIALCIACVCMFFCILD